MKPLLQRGPEIEQQNLLNLSTLITEHLQSNPVSIKFLFYAVVTACLLLTVSAS
jgi:hypothetical protein